MQDDQKPAVTRISQQRRVVLIGVDDTDSTEPDAVGTGQVARQIAGALASRGMGRPLGVTRHQLLTDPAIAYTSHNSALCIGLESDAAMNVLVSAAAEGLAARAQPGSDPGLCVFALSARQGEAQTIERFGLAAAERVLTKEQAYKLAHSTGAHLSEHGGTGDGVIGALAAVGQRAGGESGRFVDAPGVRELEDREILTVGDLIADTAIARVEQWDGTALPADAEIAPAGWLRPSLRGGVAVLLVEQAAAVPNRWVPVEAKRTRNGHGRRRKGAK